MSIFNKLIAGLGLVILTASSCKKDEKQLLYLGGTTPVLTASVSGSIPLAYADSIKQAIALNWTNPEYQFNTGVSSQNVSYLVEIDTVGANFTNPNRQTVGISNNLAISWTNAQLNDYLLNQLQLVPGIQHNIEIRVKASMINNSAMLASAPLQFKVTPYAIPPKVTPPVSGTLYITGAATPLGWQCACGTDDPGTSQKFTKVSNTLYELPSITLNGGQSYLLIPVYSSWGAKYGGTGLANNTNNVNGDDFMPDGKDLLSPPATGKYKIVVDFQRGKFTVTPI